MDLFEAMEHRHAVRSYEDLSLIHISEPTRRS